MAAPSTPPTKPDPFPSTPPRVKLRGNVAIGVVFVNAESQEVIWQSCREVSVLGALHEIAQLLDVNVWDIQLFNEIGPLDARQDIDDPVVSVALINTLCCLIRF